jgi:hypothetical protein
MTTTTTSNEDRRNQQLYDGIELAAAANDGSPDPTNKKQENWMTFRKREALLSRISIYIVFMFVSCHRFCLKLYVINKTDK